MTEISNPLEMHRGTLPVRHKYAEADLRRKLRWHKGRLYDRDGKMPSKAGTSDKVTPVVGAKVADPMESRP
jgi:hypothetical protein